MIGDRHREAIGTDAAMPGAIVLARPVDDRALSDGIPLETRHRITPDAARPPGAALP